MMRGIVTRTAAAAALALVAGAPASAQTLDAVEVANAGSEIVVRIRFDPRVQYQRSAPAGEADLVQVFFRIYAGDERAVTPVEEQRQLAATDRTPALTVTFPVQTGQPVDEIDVRFASPVRYRARQGPDSRSIELVLDAASARAAVTRERPAAANAAAAAAAGTDRNRYALMLQTMPLARQDRMTPVPSQFDEYIAFTSQSIENGVPLLELDLGYFATAADADRALVQARRVYPDARVVDLISRRDRTLQQSAARAAASAAAPVAAQAAPSPLPAAVPATASGAGGPSVERSAADLMAKAREALTAGVNDLAIETLSQLLLLPPNSQSQTAQELIGVAHERAGDIAGARAEYQLYLKLFPEGEGAQRVNQRLASLAPATAVAAGAGAMPPPAQKSGTFNGSIAQYYYGGDTKQQSAFSNLPAQPNQQTITSTRQSSLVTSVDLNGRYRGEESDTRAVVRDTQTKGFDSTTPSTNRLDEGYVDYRLLPADLELRLGRQPGSSGALPARFDGLSAGLGFGRAGAPHWRVNAAVGAPADIVIDRHERFGAASLEVENLAGGLGGDVFFLEQRDGGTVDRRAAGAEARYFGDGRSLYALADYDTSYHRLEAATLQGTLALDSATTLTLLVDDRTAPTLATSNALLLNPGVTSLRGLLQTSALADVRREALAITATSRQALLGVSRQVTDHWQLSADARLTNVGALPQITIAGTTFAAQPGTGNVMNYDLQATGSNLFSKRDIGVAVLTYLASPTYKGELLSLTELVGLHDNRFDLGPSLRLYHQRDAQDVGTLRVTPGLRADYRLTPRFSIESEATVEWSRVHGAAQRDDTTTRFYYVGYRYDLP
jgi:hypothetical protein